MTTYKLIRGACTQQHSLETLNYKWAREEHLPQFSIFLNFFHQICGSLNQEGYAPDCTQTKIEHVLCSVSKLSTLLWKISILKQLVRETQKCMALPNISEAKLFLSYWLKQTWSLKHAKFGLGHRYHFIERDFVHISATKCPIEHVEINFSVLESH